MAAIPQFDCRQIIPSNLLPTIPPQKTMVQAHGALRTHFDLKPVR